MAGPCCPSQIAGQWTTSKQYHPGHTLILSTHMSLSSRPSFTSLQSLQTLQSLPSPPLLPSLPTLSSGIYPTSSPRNGFAFSTLSNQKSARYISRTIIPAAQSHFNCQEPLRRIRSLTLIEHCTNFSPHGH